MGASELIGRLAIAGVRLSASGPNLIAEPRQAITDELRALIRENKPELLAALAPVGHGVDSRRQRVLAKLAAEPDQQRVAIFDTDAEPDVVICTIAIRNAGTCELRVPSDRYNPWAVLESLQKTQ